MPAPLAHRRAAGQDVDGRNALQSQDVRKPVLTPRQGALADGCDPAAKSQKNLLQVEEAVASGKPVLTPRHELRAAGSRETAKDSQRTQQNLAELRRRALAALNLGLPEPVKVDADEAADDNQSDDGLDASASAASAKCTCLRRSGRCTCAEDRAWLQSKRHETSKYVPPHARKAAAGVQRIAAAPVSSNQVAGAEEDADLDSKRPCICLRRSGRCTCRSDSTWLQRKRRCVVPYVPPHVKARQLELEQMRAKAAKAVEEAERAESTAKAAGRTSEAGSVCTGSSFNVRSLARQWGPRLQRRGECRFNPLQMDGQLALEDTDGIVVECIEHSLSMKGVKGLPVIRGGSYQYEVELLRDSSLVIGWSGAMTLPADFDFQGYGFSSLGSKHHNYVEAGAYGESFGKAGDVVGAFLKWTGGADEARALQISFSVNGRPFGTAFEVISLSAEGDGAVPVPMQPHICQMPTGPMLQVRLRGASEGSPLKYPVDGYLPISAISEEHFCPFAAAVGIASTERAAAAITEEQLRSFCVPDLHILELYDIPHSATFELISAAIMCFLALPTPTAAGLMHLVFTEPGVSTALLACRRPTHAERLVASGPEAISMEVNGCLEHLAVRSIRHATAASRERLRQERGEAYRPQADCSAARRLIHGSLQSQIPLSHLIEEKNRHSRVEQGNA